MLRISTLLLLCTYGAIAMAEIETELRYTADLEEHTEAPDETTSILSLSLSDDRAWESYSNRYSLEFTYNYEHEENEDNPQQEGFYDGIYQIGGPELVWNLNADFEVFAEESGEEIDRFRSQNLTTLSTGPTARLFRQWRGVTELAVLATSSDYSESNLDSSQQDLALTHAYPISETRAIDLSLFYRSIEYDDEFNAAGDYDATGLSLTFSSQARDSEFRLLTAVTDFDNDANTPNQDEFSLTYIYRLTPRSSIDLQVADILETSAEFNRANPTDNNDLFLSSLIRNERVSLGYTYTDSQNTIGISVYNEKLEILFGVGSADDVTGYALGWTRQITDGLLFYIDADVSENDFLGSRFEALDAALIYTRQHSQRLSSELEWSTEIDEIDGDRVQDNIVAYRFNAILYRQ